MKTKRISKKDYQGGYDYGNGNFKQLQQLFGTEYNRKQCDKQHEEEGSRKDIEGI